MFYTFRQFYVLLEDGSRYRNRVIERHGFDGDQYELPKMPYKPDRIAVEQSTGNLILHDSQSWSIMSFDVQTGASSVIAKDVPLTTELHPWLTRTFWTTLDQPGFFGVVEPKAKTTHVSELPSLNSFFAMNQLYLREQIIHCTFYDE